MVGVHRFELWASCSQSKRSSLAELHPDATTVASPSPWRQAETRALPTRSLMLSNECAFA